MYKIYFLIKFLFIFLFIISAGFAATSNSFAIGKKFFDNKEYEKSKIFFERDLVFNHESEKSYLYLAKIFNENDNDQEEEINLRNVLLLNPQNDEAIYMLAILKIKQSDYRVAKELIEKFNMVCESFCSKRTEIQEKFDKLEPENARDNN